MITYTLLYRDGNLRSADVPLGFVCQADDIDHAEEQLWDFEPNADIVWAYEGDDLAKALEDYYTNGF